VIAAAPELLLLLRAILLIAYAMIEEIESPRPDVIAEEVPVEMPRVVDLGVEERAISVKGLVQRILPGRPFHR
jgi:hypothetical protein